MNGRIVSRHRDGRLQLTIDRAERANALTRTMVVDLQRELSGVGDDPTVRVVTIAGSGERVFCGGFDLRSIAVKGPSETGVAELMQAVSTCPVPVIAVLNGHAVGAGFELAARCDLRIARRGVRVGLPAVQLGVAYRVEGLAAIVRAAPAATRSLLTGSQLPIERIPGFADEIVDEDGLFNTVQDWCRSIGDASPAAVAYTVRVLRSLRNGGTEQVRQRFEEERDAIMRGPDVGEAVRARREGRAPRFPGREAGQ